MSSTLLEVTRASHEEVERLERLITKELQNEPAHSKERLYQSHRVRLMIEHIISTTNKLVEIYDDKDGARKDEIAALGGQTANGTTNVFSAFYDRLKEIREYHRRFPAARVVDAGEEYEQMFKEDPVLDFSGEEAYGKYLDLHEFYNRYVNLKSSKPAKEKPLGKPVEKPLEYTAYIQTFSRTDLIPRKQKMTRQYKEYISHLVDYLVSYFERTEPLKDIDRIFSKVAAEFEEQWANGEVVGWENEENELTSLIDLDYYATVEELIEVGPEKLKETLAALGLKSGGTVQQRAERLFLTKNTPLENLDRKHFAKPQRLAVNNGDENGNVLDHKKENLKDLALAEAKLKKLCELLDETIIRTYENAVKKQGMTADELRQEQEEEDEQADSESDEDEQPIYNPLKLPLGWDGKPIPYWLYKLHGLGQEFKCEICGNYSYWGRRAFERHFKEWRHQHGMRCLGIPNTKNFNEITSIQDAKDLWERIQKRQGVHKWRPDLEEEYEDQEGNIYNKKTYTDLQRQGLI